MPTSIATHRQVGPKEHTQLHLSHMHGCTQLTAGVHLENIFIVAMIFINIIMHGINNITVWLPYTTYLGFSRYTFSIAADQTSDIHKYMAYYWCFDMVPIPCTFKVYLRHTQEVN